MRPRLPAAPFTAVLLAAGLVLLSWTPRAPATDRALGRLRHGREAFREVLRRDGVATVIVTLEGAGPAHERGRALRRERDGRMRDVESRLERAGGGRSRYRMRRLPCLLVELHEDSAWDLLEDTESVCSIELDRRGRGGLRESVPLIRAPVVREQAYDGTGAVVAILDSGVDSDHPALADSIIHEYHFLDQGRDTGPGAEDDHGHGTNVTGIVASAGGVAPRGVAPNVDVIAVKVLDEHNSGWFSDWASGVDHVLSLMDDEGLRVDVINMSLVSYDTFSGPCDDTATAFSRICREAEQRGVVLVASAGNEGQVGSMTLPACYSSVIAVGSVNDSLPLRLSSFSNRGPLLDVLAPGSMITSAGLRGGTSTFAGTSQAAPHVAAVAALLRQVNPSLSPSRVRELLGETGRWVADGASGTEYPLIDASAAVDAALDSIQAEPTAFLRADCNPDGWIDISDPVTLLIHLFSGAVVPSCLAACDSNGDRVLNLSDAVFSLNYSFLGAAAPPGPFPECGLDLEGAAVLGCEESACSPD